MCSAACKLSYQELVLYIRNWVYTVWKFRYKSYTKGHCYITRVSKLGYASQSQDKRFIGYALKDTLRSSLQRNGGLPRNQE
jgi:hypothetical protein